MAISDVGGTVSPCTFSKKDTVLSAFSASRRNLTSRQKVYVLHGPCRSPGTGVVTRGKYIIT